MGAGCLMSRGCVALLSAVLILASFVLCVPSGICTDIAEVDAKYSIVAAQGELTLCYQAVANASNTGANVTGLIYILDQAAANLSMADLAFGVGDFNSSKSYATQSLNLLVQNDVVSQADALKNEASQAAFWGFMINIVGSLVGAVAVLVVGFVLWVKLGKRYGKATGGVN